MALVISSNEANVQLFHVEHVVYVSGFLLMIVTQMMLHIPLQMIKVKMVPLKELYE